MDERRHLSKVHWRLSSLSIIVCVFFASIPNIFLMTFNEGHESSEGGTSTLFYSLALMAYLSAAVGALVRLNGNVTPALRAWPVWLNVAFALLSTTWSIVPSLTLSRAIGLLGTTVAAAFFATFPGVSQLRSMVIAFGCIMAVSLSLAIIAPDIAITGHKGEMVVRGIYVHKNNAGWGSAIFFVTAYGAYRAKATRRVLSLSVMFLSSLSVLLSRSATSILAIGIGLITFWMLGVLRRSGRSRPLVGTMAFGGLVFAMISAVWILPLVLEAFDKTVTLSGRTTLWTALGPAIQQRIFVGWGFGGALWESEVGRDFFRYTFFAGNAQGGYAEVLVNSGIIGCLLLFLPYSVCAVMMLRLSNDGDRAAETFLACLITIAFLGVTAPVFMAVNQIFWIMIAMAMFYQAGASTAYSRVRRLPHEFSPPPTLKAQSDA